MLRCKTDSEKESARGGPVSSASKERGGCEISTSLAPLRYSFRTKSRAFAVTLIFAAVTARNVLQHGRTESFWFAGALSDEFMCIGHPCGVRIFALIAPNKQWFDNANHAIDTTTTTAIR
jgi:hypothetical protein